MDKARVHIFVSGIVQGVFYRKNTKQKAQLLGITGWVKNLSNGQVEVLAEGYKGKLEDLIKWLKKGPYLSRVDKLEINWKKYTGEFDGFRIIF